MFSGRSGPQGAQVDSSIIEYCDRIKKEFSLLQQQCQSLKFDCEKLAQEKIEVHRQYVMYYEMSYGLNVEMHRQSELAKRYLAICHQILPCLSQEQQNQVAATLERAKQVTVAELNTIIGQQMHAQGVAFPHGHGQAPHFGASPFGLPGAGGLPPGLLALQGVAAAAQQAFLKDEKDNLERAAASSHKRSANSPHHLSDKYRGHSRSPLESKKHKRDEESDGEKSDGDLVVDDTNENDKQLTNGSRSPHENGDSSKLTSAARNKSSHHDDNSRSPHSDNGSARSTPSQKGSEKSGSAPITTAGGTNASSSGSSTNKSSSRSGVRHSPKLPPAAPYGPFGAFMPENLAAFAAGLNSAFGGNPVAAAAARNSLTDLYSAMRGPQPQQQQQQQQQQSLLTSASAATSGNLIERNGNKQHYSFHCDSYDPSPSTSSLQPYTFPSDAFEMTDCPRRTKILSHLIHGDVVCAVTISDLNKHIYTGGKGCVKIWDLKESTKDNNSSPMTINKPIGQFECLSRDAYIRSGQDVRRRKGKEAAMDEEDAAPPTGCWIRLPRLGGGCMSSGSKVDSSTSGACANASESKKVNHSCRDQSAAPAASGSTTSSNIGSISPSSIVGEELKLAAQLRRFTFNELKCATRNFRPESLLGEGGFGCVFKGWIEENGTAPMKPGTGLTVAVKTLNHDGLQGHKEWVAEVDFLGNLQHPHLVKLVGYCIEDDQRLLVYEFMPRGSLENHLFRRSFPLPWAIRMKIALGAAKGLAFLHEEAERPVIYRDFKTSNILLDAEYNAKLSDFGLAKDGPEGDKTHVSTRVMGTYGYAAPEYVMTGHLTSKSDVYSFGVVLLEMMSGRRSMDKNRPNGEHNLVEWARPYLGERRRFYRLVDPRLEGNFSIKGAQKTAQLAHACLSRDPKARPLMSQVVEVLKPLPNLKDMASSSYFFQSMRQERAASLNNPNGSQSMKAQSTFARNGVQPMRSLSYGPHASPYRQSPRPNGKQS